MTRDWPASALERLADAVPPIADGELAALARAAASQPRQPQQRPSRSRHRIVAASATLTAVVCVSGVLAVSLPRRGDAPARRETPVGSALVQFPAADAVALLVGRHKR